MAFFSLIRPPSKIAISIFVVIILLLGLVIAVIGSKQNTENRSRAAGPNTITVTDYQADFSGNQGEKGWHYGFSTGAYNGSNFQPMTAFNNGVWQVDPNNYWIQIARDNMHPNSTTTTYPRQPAFFDVVKRWVSTVSGQITISGNVADLDPTDSGAGEDGIWYSIWVDGQKIREGYINNGDTNGVNYNVTPTVHVGSTIDFVVNANNNDYNDTTRFDVLITQQVTPSSTPTSTPTPTVSGSTKFKLELLLHGIGKAGDSASPGIGGNMNPIHMPRTVTVDVYDGQQTLVTSQQGVVNYASASGSFTGTIDMGELAAGTYEVRAKLTQSLQGVKTVPVKPGTTVTIPKMTLITGDVDNNNTVNALDYNILLDCYSEFSSAKSCDPGKQVKTDLTDDGKVNLPDLNLFLRELTNIFAP